MLKELLPNSWGKKTEKQVPKASTYAEENIIPITPNE